MVLNGGEAEFQIMRQEGIKGVNFRNCSNISLDCRSFSMSNSVFRLRISYYRQREKYPKFGRKREISKEHYRARAMLM